MDGQLFLKQGLLEEEGTDGLYSDRREGGCLRITRGEADPSFLAEIIPC